MQDLRGCVAFSRRYHTPPVRSVYEPSVFVRRSRRIADGAIVTVIDFRKPRHLSATLTPWGRQAAFGDRAGVWSPQPADQQGRPGDDGGGDPHPQELAPEDGESAGA